MTEIKEKEIFQNASLRHHRYRVRIRKEKYIKRKIFSEGACHEKY
jgi:hypothetical protein